MIDPDPGTLLAANGPNRSEGCWIPQRSWCDSGLVDARGTGVRIDHGSCGVNPFLIAVRQTPQHGIHDGHASDCAAQPDPRSPVRQTNNLSNAD